jgi:hypothetical protein
MEATRRSSGRHVQMRVLLLVLLAAPSGCALRGPALTPTSHLAYNEAVQQSEQRELLLNLVRLRYLEAPEFLAISSISSQMQFDARASLGGTFGDDQTLATRLITPGAEVGYSESPTVTFAPRHSDEFTRRLVAPVDLDRLYLLVRYGWSLERTLRLVAEQVNELRNVATRESLTAADVESIVEFAELARTLDSLYTRRLVDIDVEDQWSVVATNISTDGVAAQDFVSAAASGYRLELNRDVMAYDLQLRVPRYVLRIAPEGRGLPEVDALLARLGLRVGEALYELDSRGPPGKGGGSVLAVRTRSVLGAMAYLSHGVAVPDADIASGSAARSELGAAANQALIRISSSDEPPTSTALSVQYRSHWFYIEDRDLESRRTLGALTSLVRLQIGAGDAQTVPVLTLPVAR